MTIYIPFVAGGLAAACCLLAGWGLYLYREQPNAAHLPPNAKRKVEDDDFILAKISELVGRPFGGVVLGILGNRGRAQVRRRLARADRLKRISVERYAQRKAGDVIFYGVLGLLFLNIQFLVGLIVIIYGITVTDLNILIQAQRRQEEIQKALPDFLDVLAVTVSAGLGFRLALARVAASMPGPLSDEFEVTLQQMELGASRREAFEEMRSRNNSSALGQFITALLQAEELGAPLAQALNEISVDMRRESAQWARRRAQKVNPRITLVTLATIVPGLILLVGGAMFLGSDVDFSGLFGG